MALINCKACGSQMSREAQACPHCAHPNKEANYVSGGTVFMALAMCFGIIWYMVSSPDGGSSIAPQPSARDRALAQVQLSDVEWYKSAGGSIMMLSAVVTNSGPGPVKDITIECQHSSNSGTRIDSNIRTIYERYPAGVPTPITDFNMGFMHDQATRSTCRIINAAPG